ncbi:MAG: hypothetical protein Q8K15_00025, partial [Candidatus Omnitrophota bacterium]|nr:hypothetical protein [Candidatus Omnitrophota bacterium]
MEKRLVLAIALSLLILLSWSALVTKTQPIGNKQVTQLQTMSSSGSSPAVTTVLSQVKPEPAKELVHFKQDDREIIFDAVKAAIVEIVFKANREHRLTLTTGFYSDDNNLFKLEKINKDSISFVYQDQNKRVIK